MSDLSLKQGVHSMPLTKGYRSIKLTNFQTLTEPQKNSHNLKSSNYDCYCVCSKIKLFCDVCGINYLQIFFTVMIKHHTHTHSVFCSKLNISFYQSKFVSNILTCRRQIIQRWGEPLHLRDIVRTRILIFLCKFYIYF